MDLNATLLGQMITFAIFVGITMKWVWPLFTKVLDERKQKITDGLVAAEKGHRELELAERRSKTMVEEARQQASTILDEANQRVHRMIEEAKETARQEGERMITNAQREMQQQTLAAREQLRQEIAGLAMIGAERILKQAVNDDIAQKAVNDVIAEL